MIVFEMATSTPPLTHDHLRCEYPVLDDVRVELHFVAGDWIDEGRYEFEESRDQEWYIDYQRKPKTLWIMVLKNAKDSPTGAKGRMFRSVGKIDEETYRSI